MVRSSVLNIPHRSHLAHRRRGRHWYYEVEDYQELRPEEKVRYRLGLVDNTARVQPLGWPTRPQPAAAALQLSLPLKEVQGD